MAFFVLSAARHSRDRLVHFSCAVSKFFIFLAHYLFLVEEDLVPYILEVSSGNVRLQWFTLREMTHRVLE